MIRVVRLGFGVFPIAVNLWNTQRHRSRVTTKSNEVYIVELRLHACVADCVLHNHRLCELPFVGSLVHVVSSRLHHIVGSFIGAFKEHNRRRVSILENVDLQCAVSMACFRKSILVDSVLAGAVAGYFIELNEIKLDMVAIYSAKVICEQMVSSQDLAPKS